MNIKDILVFTLIVFAISACSPEINALRINDASNNNQYEHNETLTVEADVTVNSGGAGTPVVYTRPRLPPNASYQEVTQLTNKTLIGNDQYRYSGELSFNYGAYDLRVTVPYSAWLTRQYVSAQTNLNIVAPDYCFGFDSSTMGFSLGKVTLSNNTERADTIPLGGQLHNWPEQANGHGSISFDITTQHFPSPPEETRYWYIDFISPDLSQIDAWQQSQGMTFRLSSQAGHLSTQPIIYIQGQNNPFAPKDPQSNQFLYYPISNEPMNGVSIWNVVQWHSSPDLPNGVREKIHIRIYGDAGATTINNNRTVFLDGVCPIPPGITPAGGEVITPVTNPIQ